MVQGEESGHGRTPPKSVRSCIVTAALALLVAVSPLGIDSATAQQDDGSPGEGADTETEPGSGGEDNGPDEEDDAAEDGDDAPDEGDTAPEEAGDDSAQASDADENTSESDDSDPSIEKARGHIERGEQLFENEDYEAALVEFKNAHELLGGHEVEPLVLYNIAKCHEKLFQYDRAMNYYRRYLDEAGSDAEDRAEVKAKIDMLEGLLATVYIEVNTDSYEVWVDDKKVGDDKSRILVPGGSHVMEIRAPKFVTGRKQFEVAARAERTLRFELERRAEQYEGVSPMYFWGSAGLAVLSAGAGAVVGVMALTSHNDVDERLSDERRQWGVTEDDVDQIDKLALGADIMFGAAALFAVTATTLAFLTDWERGEAKDGTPDEENATAALRFRPRLSPRSAGVWMETSF